MPDNVSGESFFLLAVCLRDILLWQLLAKTLCNGGYQGLGTRVVDKKVKGGRGRPGGGR